MKNFTLLFVLLLPFFGFSQIDLVRWNSSDFTPTTTADFVTGYAIDASNVSLQANNYGINDTFFHTSGWPSNNTASQTHYIQFRANADNGFKIKPTSFNFKAKTTSAPMKLKVIAAKNANFNNSIEILSETNVTGSYVNYTASFPANFLSNPNGNIFIRIYVYGTYNNLLINYDNSLTTGPVLKGSLTTEEVYAVNDIVNIDKNTSSSINVLANDYSGTGSFTSVSNLTTPTNAAGTVTVNANNTIQFVPATGFTGSSTFNYKVTSSTGSSAIATVTVNVSEPALAEWNLSSNSNVTFQQSYVSATNLSFTQFGANYSSLGMAISHTEDANFQHYRAFDLKIKPTAGSVLNITNLVFEQERLATNSSIGASNYQIKYKIVTGNFNEGTYSFFNTATVLINDESVASNPSKNIPFNVSVNENQTLVVRFYARGGNDYNFNGWRIKTNTLKLRGTVTAPCTNPPIQITSDMILTGKLDVCSCTVAANKKLTIKEGAILNVEKNIVVEAGGKIIVESGGALVQTNDDATYTGNNESFLLKRTTTPVSRFDFTYWSSPLKTSSDFLVGRDQTNPNRKGLSKTTFFDKYYSYSGAAQAWITIPYGTEVMVPAKGYIVRAPQEFAITNTPSATFTANFEGVPNNGVITLPLSISTVGKSNLIGNPYPSAIDAYKFIDENAGLMDGTFYFWTHNIALSSTPDANGILQYNPASYISLNKTGSTSNGKNSPKASRNIAAGQGFFINSTNAGAITFNNSMRVTKKNSNSSFFRMANTTQSSEETNEEIEETAVEANRVWLNISNAAGAYNETLIGYVSGATNNLEDAYDGITYASGTAIYTLQSNKKLVIQGRALPFVNTDVVPLGFMAATAGEYTIAIESFDGLFEDQKVFLVDRTDNSIHNLKNESYTFTSQAGTFDSRFEIRYVNDSTLGTDNPIITQNDVVVFKSANQISVRANNLTIDNVQVYDITGKLITSAKNINDSTFTTSGLNVATQVLIVKVTLDDNQTISKKVIMN